MGHDKLQKKLKYDAQTNAMVLRFEPPKLPVQNKNKKVTNFLNNINNKFIFATGLTGKVQHLLLLRIFECCWTQEHLRGITLVET